jgi:hypothetical protein
MNEALTFKKKMILLGAALLLWGSLQSSIVHSEGNERHSKHESRSGDVREHEEDEDDEYDNNEYDDDAEQDLNLPAATESSQIQKEAPKPTTDRATLAYTDGDTVSLRIPELPQPLKVKLAVRDGVPMVPADVVFDGLQVPYSHESGSPFFEAYVKDHHLIFREGKKVFFDNGVKYALAAAPFEQNERFDVPLNVLADCLGYTVKWNPQQQSFDWKRGD